MKKLVIKGQKRTALGKKDSKKLRSQEIVPAVVYGGKEPVHFSVSFNELRKLVYTPHVYLIDLDIDGQVYPAIMQDVQWHAVEEQILHVDFLMIDGSKPVKIDIPVKITGIAKGIKAGGKLKMNLRKLKVKALAENLPDEITIDITKLGIGDSIKVEDISRDNLQLLDNKSSMIVSVVVTRVAKSASELEDEEDEEGKETEGGEGSGDEQTAEEQNG
ncbi:MAG: 50S ribosomal protein L25/general stress protein Ctc [Draconibacterium sp.]|nr:MAG: 50S ribosomal protein L25/general stress protein Ctc [Draconibacterium sp.]